MGIGKQMSRHPSKGCKQRLDTIDRVERTQEQRRLRYIRRLQAQ